jgi:hypothetical protein
MAMTVIEGVTLGIAVLGAEYEGSVDIGTPA